MKKVISISLIMLCFIGLSAQNTSLALDVEFEQSTRTLVAPEVVQNLKANRSTGQSRVAQVITVDYSVNDAAHVTAQGGIYQEFRGYYINKYWPNNVDADRNVNWLAQYISKIYDENNVEYDLSLQPYTLDSVDVIVSHLNNSGTQDSIRVIIYEPSTNPNDRGVATNSSRLVTNTVLWDTIITTTASISAGEGSFNLLTVYPDPNLTLGANGYVIGLEYYGDTLNRLDVIGGYADYCGDACLAEPSFIPNNTHFSYIRWQTNPANGQLTELSSVINGDRPLYFDCDDSQDGSATPGGCEYFGFQNANFVSYLTLDPPLQLNPTANKDEACPDEIIELNSGVIGGVGPYEVFWTGGNGGQFTAPTSATTSFVAPDFNGNVVVSIMAVDLGSLSDTVRNTIVIDVNAINVDLGGDVTIPCSDSIDLIAVVTGAATGRTFEWNDASTGSTLNNVKDGTYSVTVTNPSGCTANDVVVISIPVDQDIDYTVRTILAGTTDTISIGGNATCQNSKTVFTNNSINVMDWSWEWDYGRQDPIISLSPSPSTTYPNAGTFTLTISADSSICTVTKSEDIVVLPETHPSCDPTGIVDAEWLTEFVSVYPNPNSGLFDVDLTTLTTTANISISVFDMTGKVVFENTNVESNTIQTVDLSNASSGFYFARVQVGNDFITTKIGVNK